jgi:thiol:disulfide interchange protein DsbA
MLQRFAFIVAGLLLVTAGHAEEKAAPAAAAHTWEAGQDYVLINPPVPTSTGDKIEVLEVFSYACPHCAHFQPYVDQLKAKLPSNAQFVSLPAVFNPAWEPYARGFYTAQSFGILDKSNQALLDAIHRDHKPLRTIQELAQFYADYGVKPENFLSTAGSFVIDGKLAHGNELVRSYGVEGTPTLIVNGKYRVSVNDHGVQFPEMIAIAEFLVAQESAGKKAK